MNDNENQKKGRTRFFIFGVLMVVVALAGLIALIISDRARTADEARDRLAAIQAGPVVNVVKAVKSPETRSLSFVGESRPFATVTLYAKISGYIGEVLVDKGDKVQAGQLLATIESPELDRQYAAAVADARSKRADADRSRLLLQSQSVSVQSYEQTLAAAEVSEGNAAAILAQKNYEKVSAPFGGTITARFVDPGALVQSATNAQTTALPLFTLSQTGRLRIFIYPDQKSATFIQVGDPAEVTDSARPDIMAKSTVARISGELDQKTRTMLVEIDLDNEQGRFVPGGYLQVTLQVKMPSLVEIPARALVMRNNESFVPTLTETNRVKFQPVDIYQSDGKTVQLRSGISVGTKVILSVGETLTEGHLVQPVVTETGT
jgi:membrane fusion protein, multidrug efflux system